jgi:hypothetical protein
MFHYDVSNIDTFFNDNRIITTSNIFISMFPSLIEWKAANVVSLCRLCAVLLWTRLRDGRAARGRRLAAVAVGELGSARSSGIVGRKKHGFRGRFGGCG